MSAMSQIDVTPLIDLAFSLLIIFMISTPLLEQTIPLQLPLESQRPQPPRDDLRIQVISVDRNGQVFWGVNPVTLDQLNENLAVLAKDSDPPVLSIRGDASIPYQKIIDVIDRVKANNLSRISLDTQVK